MGQSLPEYFEVATQQSLGGCPNGRFSNLGLSFRVSVGA
jgi:hypothetical protein